MIKNAKLVVLMFTQKKPSFFSIDHTTSCCSLPCNNIVLPTLPPLYHIRVIALFVLVRGMVMQGQICNDNCNLPVDHVM